MNLHDYNVVPGSHKKPKRRGIGLGSGNGKTAGKGHKGQKARTGGGVSPHFEGGQMPLYRRTPKRGFSNFRFSVVYTNINVDDLEKHFADGDEVTIDALKEHKLIKGASSLLKVLGNGELKKKLTVKANAYSASAKKKIEAAGGRAEVI